MPITSRLRRPRTFLAVLLATLGGAGMLSAQTGDPATASAAAKPSRQRLQLRIPRLSSPVQIDGVLEEEAWSQALKMDVAFEIDPGRNVPAPVTTVAYLAYDDERLYAAFRADDPDPGAIRAHLADRDTTFRDDFVGIFFDTFNDPRRGFEVFVNPLGVQMDLSIDETNSDEREDASWDIIWDSAGRIDERGYVVEFAIPFSSLRFQRSEGEQTWGIGAFRSYPRSLRHQISSVPLDPDDGCILCQIPQVTGFAGVTPGRNIELDPTATARRTDVREDFPRGGISEGSTESDLGMTARWGITPNVILTGAVNPDFSQVEADAAQFDVNTQFALFFPERRPFFLEGADFFATPFSIIHTRTVADPAWGVKLTGKEGRHGFGVFVTEDEITNILLPGSQSSSSASLDLRTTDAALRYRLDLGASSSVGAAMTHRKGTGYSNDLLSVDGRWRPTATDVLTFQAMSSRTEYPLGLAGELDLPTGRLEGSALRAAYNHGSRNWTWYARYEDIDPELRADLGFMPQVGTTLWLGGLERTWWAKERSGWYTSLSAGGDWDQTEAPDGTVLEREAEAWLQLRGPLQSLYMIDHGRRERFWHGRTYDEKFTHLEVEVRPSGALFLTLAATVGDTIDFDHDRAGDLLRLRPSIDLNLGRSLRLELDHDLQKVDVAGGELLELNVSQLRAIYQLNLRTFLRAVLQYTDVAYNTELYTAEEVERDNEHLFSQLLFSYKLNPQTVLFVGYSDNQIGGELEGHPLELTRSDRTLFLKLGYALVM
ncbi:MAG TPA: DUF5916 domain-containing protein [Thermoanaerobaculia bacterium]|nr:DUF5916 domain-containing protein [Thermoanaerobaculia bacterium]